MNATFRIEKRIRVILWYFIFSNPVNAICAVFSRASARIMIDVIWIRGTMYGLLKIWFPINPERVKVTIDNVIPRIVSNIVDGYQSAGNYSVTFNAKELASGIYYYRLVSEDYTDVKKMLLVKWKKSNKKVSLTSASTGSRTCGTSIHAEKSWGRG